MEFIRFFLPKNNDFGPLIRSANALASRIQGSVADGIDGLESRVTAAEADIDTLESKLPQMGTPQTTSGTETFVDFTGIPSWVTNIIISITAISTNGTAVSRLRLGTAGGIATTGYSGASASYSGAAVSSFTAGFDGQNSAAAAVRRGAYRITKLSSSANIWSCVFSSGRSDTGAGEHGAGECTLSGALTQIRWTTSNGTDTIDANGIFNIWYE